MTISANTYHTMYTAPSHYSIGIADMGGASSDAPPHRAARRLEQASRGTGENMTISANTYHTLYTAPSHYSTRE
jgi:hypothetical protein